MLEQRSSKDKKKVQSTTRNKVIFCHMGQSAATVMGLEGMLRTAFLYSVWL